MPETVSIRSRYDDVSPTYEVNSHDQDLMRLYFDVYEHLTLRGLESVLPPPGTSLEILDAGGGGGKYGVWLAQRGHHVTVLDISPGMLEQARQRFASSNTVARAFVEGDVLALPFADESFDLVFCEGDPVSYCLDKHVDAIRELLRVGKHGAPIILGVDNRYAHFVNTLLGEMARAALAILRTGQSICPYGLPVHAFTLAELEKAVKAAGANIIEIFGKPVLFFEVVKALQAERGADFNLHAARDEIMAMEDVLAHGGFAALGGHFQVMARKP